MHPPYNIALSISWNTDQHIIQILGRNRLLNELLASFFENESSLQCRRLLDDYPNSVKQASAQTAMWLQLIDWTDSGLSGEWDAIVQRSGSLAQQCLCALFNVNPAAGIETEVLQKGARGIFYCSDSLEMVCKGIKKILNGDIWFSRESLIQCIRQQAPPEASNGRHKETQEAVQLTFREKSILLRLRQGASNQEIADELAVSIHTVKSHLYSLYKKIDVPNRFQATLWAASNLD